MLSEYDYPLPESLIAQEPLKDRSSSRLMVLSQDGIEHKRFHEIADYLKRGDVLVVNDTKVVPARIRGKKKTGGRVEALILGGEGRKRGCLLKGKNIHEGTLLEFEGHLAKVLGKEDGRYLVEFEDDPQVVLDELGEMPTPPYIKKELLDGERYQTVYSRRQGALAAPTAGLHFTEKLLGELHDRGVGVVRLTLHIGIGTFTPVRVADLSKHRMEAEYFEISDDSARAINRAKGEGRSVIVVGTSTLKALETASGGDGTVSPCSGYSDLFIHPPHRFKFEAEGLITNFHLPRSTLLMLVCAYAGRDRIMRAYEEAVGMGYRFFSFGDVMLIFGGSELV